MKFQRNIGAIKGIRAVYLLCMLINIALLIIHISKGNYEIINFTFIFTIMLVMSYIVIRKMMNMHGESDIISIDEFGISVEGKEKSIKCSWNEIEKIEIFHLTRTHEIAIHVASKEIITFPYSKDCYEYIMKFYPNRIL